MSLPCVYTPALSSGRLYRFQLGILFVFDLVLTFVLRIPLVVLVLVILGIGTLLFPLIATGALHGMFHCKITREGIESSSPIIGKPISWAEPCRVTGTPMMISVASKTSRCVLPLPALVKDQDTYASVVKSFAPLNHPLRKHFAAADVG